MEIVVHSGLGGQSGPAHEVTTTQEPGHCRIVTHTFKDWEGGKLKIIHFHHNPPSVPVEERAP